jgi:hypothetical protein
MRERMPLQCEPSGCYSPSPVAIFAGTIVCKAPST